MILDFVSYRNQLEACRMTGGLVPHPGFQLLKAPPFGLPMTTPWQVCALGRPVEAPKPLSGFGSTVASPPPAPAPALSGYSVVAQPTTPALPDASGIWANLRFPEPRPEEHAPTPSVEIDQVRADYGAERDGREGLLIHARITAAGLQGEELQAIVFFQHDNAAHTPVESSHADYRTSDGHLCVTERLRPRFCRSVWEDLQLFLPFDVLYDRACGFWSFKYQVVVRRTAPSWKTLAESFWQELLFRVEPRAAFLKVWTEHNVDRGGERGMVIHAPLEIHNCEGREFEAIAFFYDDDAGGAPVKTSAEGFRTATGKLCVWTLLTPPYQFTEYENFELFLPYRTVTLENGPTRCLKFYLTLREKHRPSVVMADSGWQRFTLS